MEWIKGNERDPKEEGKFFCKIGKKKKCLYFQKMNPKQKHFAMNELLEEKMLDEITYWTDDVEGSTTYKKEGLLWLEE